VATQTHRKIVHAESGRVLVDQARWCDGFASKLRGFMFRRSLEPGEGLVLVESGDGRMNTAIHMLFVFVQLGVIWVNDAGQVVDTALARPWRLSYAPQAPARYVVEASPAILEQVSQGDHIQFVGPTAG
jgi:uncharacterized membrane protein (UPF0127 family)